MRPVRNTQHARVHLRWSLDGVTDAGAANILQFQCFTNRIDAQNTPPNHRYRSIFGASNYSSSQINKHKTRLADRGIDKKPAATAHRPIWYSKCVKRFSTQRNAHEKLFCSFRTFVRAHTHTHRHVQRGKQPQNRERKNARQKRTTSTWKAANRPPLTIN